MLIYNMYSLTATRLFKGGDLLEIFGGGGERNEDVVRLRGAGPTHCFLVSIMMIHQWDGTVLFTHLFSFCCIYGVSVVNHETLVKILEDESICVSIQNYWGRVPFPRPIIAAHAAINKRSDVRRLSHINKW
jgi:hypothetical protein